jgi:hypothetical protein
MEIIKDVIQKKELEYLYDKLMYDRSWYLSRKSYGDGDLTEGSYAGIVVSDGDDVIQPYWCGYFESLYNRIAEKYKNQNEHNLTLPDKIVRIHLIAKQENVHSGFHTDTEDPEAMSLIGMLTPEWETSWGGDFICEGKTLEYTPGSFVVIRSNQPHKGLGPNKKTPYWRIVINYILV